MFKKLPSIVTIKQEDVDFVLNEENDDNVVDYLSDEYGFCIFGLDIEHINKDTVVAKNIEWDTSE